jgi:uncharacterized protein YggE
MSRTVTVTGHGSATAVPDTAVVRVAAVHRAAGMADALAGAESARSAVVAAASDTALDLVVSSTDLSVWPAHDDQGRRAGFEARHALTITGGDLDAAGALVGRLADEVGERLQVESVTLSVGDPSAALGEAREAAYADARARAEHLAELADASLGKVREIAEGAGGPVPRAGAEAFAMKADVGFAPGQTVLTSTVTVTWTLV